MFNGLIAFCLAAITFGSMMISQTPKFFLNIWQRQTSPPPIAVLTVPEIPVPEKIANPSELATTTAVSALIVDEESGTRLWERNPEQTRAIGSMTKLMTVLVVLDRQPDWDKVVMMAAEDLVNGGKKNFITGEQVRVRDLFAASIIASDNDATRALARSTGLAAADFVQTMNDKARALGLRQSVFVEPTGLSEYNISTAEDVVRLAGAAFSRPEILAVAGDKEYRFTSDTGQVHVLRSTNKLYGSDLNVIVAKTGFIDQAGYCLVAKVANHGRILIAAVLGSATDSDRFSDVKTLSDWAWDNWRWER